MKVTKIEASYVRKLDDKAFGNRTIGCILEAVLEDGDIPDQAYHNLFKMCKDCVNDEFRTILMDKPPVPKQIDLLRAMIADGWVKFSHPEILDLHPMQAKEAGLTYGEASAFIMIGMQNKKDKKRVGSNEGHE